MKYSKNFYQIKSNDEISQKVKDEIDYVGYYSLPFQDTIDIKEYAQNVTQKNIVVIGIGGSTLGTYAIYNFLNKTNTYSKKLHFLESTDPTDLKSRIKEIDLLDSCYIVISNTVTT